MKFPFTLRFEQRTDDIPKWLPPVTSLGSVVVAFLISGIILKIIGGQPLLVLKFFFSATFGSWPVFSDTLVKATPLIMVGLACAVAFKMKLWNIGAEGQFYAGAVAATATGIYLGFLPRLILVPLVLIVGATGGALWGMRRTSRLLR